MKVEIPGIDALDMLMRLNDQEKNVFLTHSVTNDGWGTVFAWNPNETLVGEHSQEELEAFTKRQQALGRLTAGYLSYDFGARQHGVKLKATNDVTSPPLYCAGFGNYLEFTHDKVIINSNDDTFVAKVKEIISRQLPRGADELYSQIPKPVQARDSYKNSFARVQKHILEGDVYQINLTHRLEGNSEVSGREIFCSLARGANVDFQSYIEVDGFEIISLSPERFIKIAHGHIETMPIKGTRPRARDKATDRRLAGELRDSQKDQAELNMITDLLRNDLGKICQPGTVKVTELRKITAYPTVWHAHSKIEGELMPEISPIAGLVSVSPGGSITGCPKKRAVEIIDEIEPYRRGIYTGSIFRLTPDGALDSSIAIRTMVKHGTNVYLSVGGGIVYDSIEPDEFQESLDKAASFLVGSKSLDRDM